MSSIEISSLPLSVTDCYTMASSANAGGQTIFVGTVRNQTQNKKVLKLVFEAYTPMAIKEMQKIGLTLEERWGALKVVIHHRVGELLVGDIAVIITVSTPHRAAFGPGVASVAGPMASAIIHTLTGTLNPRMFSNAFRVSASGDFETQQFLRYRDCPACSDRHAN